MTADGLTHPELLLALQRGLPLVPRPFAALGERLGLGETAVLDCVTGMIQSGTARRLGAVFDSRSLGYVSTLCAADVPPAKLAEVAARLTPHAGITHCYEREGRPNLWFTLTAPKEQMATERARIAAVLNPHELLDLPSVRTFKIEAVFDTRSIDGHADPQKSQVRVRHLYQPRALEMRERTVVRRFQDSIPLVPEPFTVLGNELGWATKDLLALLAQWRESGILRRIGLIVRHRELGFAANGMGVWLVDPLHTAEAGRVLAGFPEVTHCYERGLHALFPFNLFAMIHAGSRDDLYRLWERMTATAGLKAGQLLVSAREFKKSSPRFFEEP